MPTFLLAAGLCALPFSVAPAPAAVAPTPVVNAAPPPAPANPSDVASSIGVNASANDNDSASAGPRDLPPRRDKHNLWLESGFSGGVDAINDRPDIIVDVRGLRAGIVDRNRAAFEFAWLPRLAYTFDVGLTLGLYGGVGFTGPSTPQLSLMLDRNGLTFTKERRRSTGAALAVMGGTFVGLRSSAHRRGYLLPTIGVHWRGHKDQRLSSKLMVDLRFDTGFHLRGNTYLAVGPSVRLAAFSWGGLSGSGMREIAFNLLVTLSHAAL